MTLPASGPLSFSAIQTEFGGTNPISLSEYYAAASGVPASGAIDVSDFYGKSAVTYTGGDYIVDDAVGSGTATASVSFNSNGEVVEDGLGGTVTSNWRTPTLVDVGADFEIKFELVSDGSGVSTPTLSTWHVLNTARQIIASRGTVGVETGQYTYEIRRISDSEVVASGSITVTAEVG